MNHNSTFFENKDCEYYPCHKGLTEINCLFCFCPLYYDQKCCGTPLFTAVKDCSDCIFPHKREHYTALINILKTRHI
ncbi:MAG: cysteine-rich small domain-containing protein [Treponema sp.]|nr:cysteine-rich small domain-containing protein [Treponema sp.]